MQVENRQARVGTFRLTRREETAAVGERQQVADLGSGPATVSDTRSQQLIEQVAAPGRKQPRTHVALFRQSLACGPIEGVMDVATPVPEALGAEIVGHTLLPELLQARIHRLVIGSQGGQAQGEPVGRMRAALQFALVTHLFEHTQAGILGTRQIRVGLARQVQAEPLAGQRLAVLQAGVADAAHRHASGAGKAPGGFFSVQVTLLDPQPQVLALAG
ncbi:hypothetical protein D3C79_614990 [compost metagenome]